MAATRGEQFAGVTVALVTPFQNGDIDWDDLAKLVDWHVAEGTDGLAPCGTTGESPTLDHDEHERVVAFVCERARGYDERCGGQWYPELLRQHRGEKHDVTVPDEVLKRVTHGSNDSPIQIFPIRY